MHHASRDLEASDAGTPDESFDHFVRQVTEAFARFNRMRRLSRNSLWMSLYCILSAAGTVTADNSPFLKNYPGVTSSMKAAAIFLWMTTIASLVWLFDVVYAFPTAHFGRLAVVFCSCSIVCIACACVEKE